MSDELKEFFQEYVSGHSDLGMLIMHITRLEGDIPISRLDELLDEYYEDQE